MLTELIEQANDVDTHEMVPLHLWGDVFGDRGAAVGALVEPMFTRMGDKMSNDFIAPDVSGDVEDITEETVWQVRGVRAPGAIDAARRIAVMDMMGSRRQLIFPSFGQVAELLVIGNEWVYQDMFGIDLPAEEVRAIGRAGVDAFNDWAVEATAVDGDRCRATGVLVPDGTIDELMAATGDLLGRGLRAVTMPSAVPPAGQSPAADALDPYWAMLAAADVPFLLHVGGEFGFLASSAWGRATAFRPGKVHSTELGFEPYTMATYHSALTNYLTVLVLGGVFERHPSLRVGVIECGAHWLGPLAQNLDMWATEVFSVRMAEHLSLSPSTYLARNVRVSPFVFEPVDTYFRTYPELADCFCYSTDYPHAEGGRDSKRRYLERIVPLGDELTARFFVRNAELLFPSTEPA